MDSEAVDRLRPPRTDIAHLPLRRLRDALAGESQRLDGASVLDLGCGTKPYASLFAGRYVGIDLTRNDAAPDCVALAEALPVRDHGFDVALSTQQLEHTDDPLRVLAEARRVLRPGGTLLLATHGVWVHHPDPQDYWRWTEQGLRRVVEQSGFTVERVHRQGEVASAGLLLAAYPLGAVARRGSRLARLLVALLNVVLGPLDRLAARLGRHYAATTYLVVARSVPVHAAATSATSPTAR